MTSKAKKRSVSSKELNGLNDILVGLTQKDPKAAMSVISKFIEDNQGSLDIQIVTGTETAEKQSYIIRLRKKVETASRACMSFIRNFCQRVKDGYMWCKRQTKAGLGWIKVNATAAKKYAGKKAASAKAKIQAAWIIAKNWVSETYAVLGEKLSVARNWTVAKLSEAWLQFSVWATKRYEEISRILSEFCEFAKPYVLHWSRIAMVAGLLYLVVQAYMVVACLIAAVLCVKAYDKVYALTGQHWGNWTLSYISPVKTGKQKLFTNI